MSLTTAILRIARAIGRWVLERLVARGLEILLGYMAGKVDDFCLRLSRTKSPQRRAWLRGRIRRWRKAIEVLLEFRRQLPGREKDLLREAERQAVPIVAPGEKFTG